jgi:hypothetical protein
MRQLKIEYRWAEGRTERYTEIAAEFVKLRVRAEPRLMLRAWYGPLELH